MNLKFLTYFILLSFFLFLLPQNSHLSCTFFFFPPSLPSLSAVFLNASDENQLEISTFFTFFSSLLLSFPFKIQNFHTLFPSLPFPFIAFLNALDQNKLKMSSYYILLSSCFSFSSQTLSSHSDLFFLFSPSPLRQLFKGKEDRLIKNLDYLFFPLPL